MKLVKLANGNSMEGMRAATKNCPSGHSEYFDKRGWRFCPWCGEELSLKIICDHCGRRFFSLAAYHVHKYLLKFYKKNPCPKAEKSEHHAVVYMKNRGRLYCTSCQISYLPKWESKQEILEIKLPKNVEASQ